MLEIPSVGEKSPFFQIVNFASTSAPNIQLQSVELYANSITWWDFIDTWSGTVTFSDPVKVKSY